MCKFTLHWLTIEIKTGQQNRIVAYDSLGIHVNDHLESISAALLFTSEKSFTISFMECHQQMGCNDCGLFSVANAFALCSGEDPTTIIWDQETSHKMLQSRVFGKFSNCKTAKARQS